MSALTEAATNLDAALDAFLNARNQLAETTVALADAADADSGISGVSSMNILERCRCLRSDIAAPTEWDVEHGGVTAGDAISFAELRFLESDLHELVRFVQFAEESTQLTAA